MLRLFYLSAIVAFFGSYSLSAQLDSILLNKVAAMVSPDSTLDNLERLTGEKETIIDGEPYLIKSRRNTNEGNHKAARYLYQKFSEYGYNPVLRHYDDYKYKDYPTAPAENVFAVSIGDESPEQYVVVCAHYDSESTNFDEAPGADDDASGVTAVLEAARIFKNLKHKYTVIFACFDHEEFGLMGSAYTVDSLAKVGVKDLRCINLDMIGYTQDKDAKTVVYQDTTDFSKPIVDIIIKTADLISLENDVIVKDFFIVMDSIKKWIIFGIGDDMPFKMQGYQVASICEPLDHPTMYPFYHSSNDKVVNLNLPFYFENIRLSVAATAAAAGVYDIKSVQEKHENILAELILSPNPADKYISIGNIEIGPNDKIEIYSQLGVKVVESSGSQIIEVEAVPPGTYFARCGGRIGRFIKI